MSSAGRGLMTTLAFVLPSLAFSNLAYAETEIGDGTTGVATSGANSGASDDVKVTGTRTLSDAGPAVTLDSNNAVNLTGAISITDQDNAIGVRILGGHSGSYTQSGSISVTSSYSPSDSNSDGVIEAPFTSGSNRYGLQVTGGTFTGSISTGTISVKGNNSFGVALEGGLIGDLSVGSTSINGDNAVGVRVAQPVTGNVSINGGLSAVGANAQGVVIDAPVSGRLSFYSSATATGFATTSRSSDSSTLSKIQGTASEVQIGGAAVTIGANVDAGVLVAAPQAGTASDSTADNDGDGVADGSQGTGTIVSYGSAPGLSIGSTAGAISIGKFSAVSGTSNSDYDLLIWGNVQGAGVYDGVAATGLQIGGTGYATTLADGMRLVGEVRATSYAADATGLRLRSGAVLGSASGSTAIWNDGSIVATINAPTSTSLRTATALLIEGGASAPTIVNNGAITANVSSDTASAYAVRDLSGSVSSLVNRGNLWAKTASTTSGVTPSGVTVALDARASSSAFAFTQETNANPVVNVSSGNSIGPSSPSTIGDLFFGSGPNTIKLTAGTVTGAMDLGGGAGSSILVDGGAVYRGALSNIGPNLSLNVANGGFYNSAVRTYSGLSNLTVGSQGVLGAAIDPANGKSTLYNVVGNASLADGANIGASVISPLTGTETYTLVTTTGALSANAAAIDVVTDTSLFYTASAANSGSALRVTLTRKAARQLGISEREAQGFDALYARSFSSSSLFATLNSAKTQDDLKQRLRAALPEHGGGILLAAIKGAEAASYAGENPALGGRGAWAREFGFGLRTKGDDTPKAKSAGMGAALGFEGEEKWFGRLRLLGDFYVAREDSPVLPELDVFDLTIVDLGLGWRAQVGGLQVGITGKGGYANMATSRSFQYWNTDGTKGSTSQLKGTSNGTFFSGVADASYFARLGAGVYVQPRIQAAVYDLRQNGYTESGDSALALKMESRNGHASKAKAEIEFGAKFGDNTKFQPRLIVGYENLFSIDAGQTVAAFAGENKFSLGNQDMKGAAALARIGFTIEGANMGFDLDGGGASGSYGASFDGRITLRARF